MEIDKKNSRATGDTDVAAAASTSPEVLGCDDGATLGNEHSVVKPSLPVVFVNNAFGSSASLPNVPLSPPSPSALAHPSSDATGDDDAKAQGQQNEGHVHEPPLPNARGTSMHGGGCGAAAAGEEVAEFPSLWSAGDHHLLFSSPAILGPVTGVACVATVAVAAAAPTTAAERTAVSSSTTADAPLAVSWTALNAARALGATAATAPLMTASVRSDETDGSTIGRPPMASLPFIFVHGSSPEGGNTNSVVGGAVAPAAVVVFSGPVD